jgi:multidrug efflux pump subunit AcrB
MTLKGQVDASKVRADLEAAFEQRPELGAIQVAVGQNAGSDDGKLSVLVKATDAATLDAAADQVSKAMTQTPEVSDVRSTLTGGGQRIEVRVNQSQAAKAGVSEQVIGQIVAAALRGTPLGKANVGGTQIPLILSSGPPPRSVEQLRSLPVATAHGTVRLVSLADVVSAPGATQVKRFDGDRAATVTGTATGSDIGATTRELTKRLGALKLPNGATYQIGGVSAEQTSAFISLGLALFAAIALVFLVMVATFRSFVQPLILLASIPFAGIGAIGALLVTDTALGLPALIGLLMLVGIVVTNAIVFMDRVNHYRREGMAVSEAVIEGGRRRLRPILMTAFATIFALLPLALGLTGEGGLRLQASGGGGDRRPGQVDAAHPGAGARALHHGGGPPGAAGSARIGHGGRPGGTRVWPGLAGNSARRVRSRARLVTAGGGSILQRRRAGLAAVAAAPFVCGHAVPTVHNGWTTGARTLGVARGLRSGHGPNGVTGRLAASAGPEERRPDCRSVVAIRG